MKKYDSRLLLHINGPFVDILSARILEKLILTRLAAGFIVPTYGNLSGSQ